MEIIKLSEISDGGVFRYSPDGPDWKRLGVVVRCVADPSHTITLPNWDANVWACNALENCECSEEYGPCENHSELLVSREGASLRTSDELISVFIDDAVSLGAELSPYGKDIVSRADAAMYVPGPMSNWLPDTEDGYELRDALQTISNQMETELDTLGYSVYWDDGYRIMKITGGPLA